ncbi:hypothetical protein [Flavivirga eckloniae]|uniref:Outer membrane protein beta-barrel domain-containing protein n=1 Tax=Flavivirga eckloniae TaxID=1803846 RepID=A0A2K9PM42_9FLAO|nr:hypothetical protein [Flavivirga eckloniae]AUP78095.1 hypothetical protein C1H87_04940 [Flavivirga eckloniae]
MKNYKILILGALIVFNLNSFSQSLLPTANIEGGYNSGFTGKVGIGFTTMNWGDQGDFSDFMDDLAAPAIGGNLQYKINRINKETFQGPNLQLFASFLGLLRVGVNGSYLFNNGNSMFIFEPEIGITAFTIITIKYTYNLTNTNGFFPDIYKKSGILLSLDIPILVW